MKFLDLISRTVPAGRLEVGLSVLRKLVNDPTNPEIGLHYLRNLDGDLHAEMARDLMQDPEGRQLLQDRPRLDAGSIRLDELARLPAGSLGQAYARFFRERRIEPFFTAAPIVSDADYITNRMRETHDLWHVVTGYGTSPTGELELQAFSYGNMGNPSSLLILSCIPGVELREDMGGLPGWLTGAYRRGRAARSFAGIYWERRWETPLAALRAELGAARKA
jgi:ubiquinone biosynthesis protein COQ4